MNHSAKPILCALLCVLLSVCNFARGGTVELARDSKIVIEEVGAFGNAQGVLTELLEGYIKKVLVRRHLAGPGPVFKIVVESGAEHWTDLNVDQLQSVADIDSYEITVSDQPEPTVHIRGNTLMAAGFGVMEFIQSELGVRFLFPGDLGTHIPQAKRLSIQTGSRKRTPEFFSRMFSGMVYSSDELRLKHKVYAGALARSSLFFKSHDYFKTLRLHHTAATSHNFMHIYPYKELRNDHPDIFPIKKGKRLSLHRLSRETGQTDAWQPCYAHPETYSRAVAKATAAFESKGGLTYSMGVNDGRNVLCECERCMAIGHPQNYFNLVSHVANSVRSYYPPRMIGFIAYGSASTPTPDLKLPENVLVTITGGRMHQFEKWSRHASHISAYEYLYGFWFSIPNLPFKSMTNNALIYDKLNVGGIYAEVYPLWAFDGPKVYIRSRLMWDRHADVDALLKEYCDAAFGNGSEPMVRLYEHWSTKRDQDHVADGITPMTPMRIRQDPKGQFARCTAQDYELTRKLIGQAASQATDRSSRARVEMVRTFFEYSNALFNLYQRHGAGLTTDATFDVPQYIAEIDALLKRRSDLFGQMCERPQWFTGSSVQAEDIQGPRWEGAWGLEDQLSTAMKSAIYNRALRDTTFADKLPKTLPADLVRYAKPGKTIIPRVNSRDTHPWYPSPRYQFMKVEKKKDHWRFTAKPNQQNESGEIRPQWIAPLLVGEPIDGKSCHLIELEVEASDGKLSWAVHSGHNNRNRALVNAIEVFDEQGGVVRRRAAAEMVRLDGRTGEVLPVVPGQTPSKGNMNIYIVWRPEAMKSRLTGALSIKRISLDAVTVESAIPEEPDFGF